MRTLPSAAAIAEALTNLRHLTACRCEAAWTMRAIHAPECQSDYREDVNVVADALEVPL